MRILESELCLKASAIIDVRKLSCIAAAQMSDLVRHDLRLAWNTS